MTSDIMAKDGRDKSPPPTANHSSGRSKNPISHYSLRIGSMLVLMTAASISLAQVLPVPTRTVYKCNVNGKTSYSDSPCVGAQRLDIEPSRGVGKSAEHDVQRERHREMLAEAVRPLTGMDAKQLDAHGRRMKLSAEAQRACRAMDVCWIWQGGQGAASAGQAAGRLVGELGRVETKGRDFWREKYSKSWALACAMRAPSQP